MIRQLAGIFRIDTVWRGIAARAQMPTLTENPLSKQKHGRACQVQAEQTTLELILATKSDHLKAIAGKLPASGKINFKDGRFYLNWVESGGLAQNA